jgi:flagellar motor switch protein FliN/FliY
MNSQQMATAHPIPAPASVQPRGPQLASAGAEPSIEKSLVPSPQSTEEEGSVLFSASVSRLSVELEVSVPVDEFRVRNLLALEPGQVIETHWAHDEDMPLAAGEVQLAWSEFEVIDTQLAVRVTRLA